MSGGGGSTGASIMKIMVELVFFGCLALLSHFGRVIANGRGREGLAQAFHVASLVCGWYSVSITLTLYNKWLVSQWKEGGLQYPIFYTMTHMMLKGCFSFSYLMCIRRKPLPKARRRIIAGSMLIGVTTALDVAASNLSFLYISVTFFTMLKSSSLIFIVILGAITAVEPCSRGVVAAISVIALGAFLSSYGEAEFNMYGFVLVMISELCAAVRWIATQMVLHGGKLDSMQAVFYMSPASAMSLVPLVLSMERNKVDAFDTVEAAGQYWMMVLFPGFLAFVLLLVEVQLVKETSSLTLSVFGNLKSIVTVLIAVIVFGERASPVQWLGLCVALSGMFGYSHVKKRKMAVDSLAQLGYEALTDSDSELDAEAASSARDFHIQAAVLGRQAGYGGEAFDPNLAQAVAAAAAAAGGGGAGAEAPQSGSPFGHGALLLAAGPFEASFPASPKAASLEVDEGEAASPAVSASASASAANAAAAGSPEAGAAKKAAQAGAAETGFSTSSRTSPNGAAAVGATQSDDADCASDVARSCSGASPTGNVASISGLVHASLLAAFDEDECTEGQDAGQEQQETAVTSPAHCDAAKDESTGAA